MTTSTTKQTIIGPALPNIPWEERPAGCRDVLWRSRRNPIIPRNLIPSSNSIFNSAVVPFGDGFAGVFRCDDKRRQMQIHSGKSRDGIRWEIQNERIHFIPTTDEPFAFEYAYDPRVCWLEDRYYVTWCNGYHGQPTIGVGYTYDFEKFYQMENAFLPHNRNGVLFPRRMRGYYAMLSRPSDRGHTPFGDIYYSESPDMMHWGHHRWVMGTVGGWQSTKVGAGPIPISTSRAGKWPWMERCSS
jgi:beta-1,4-mannooligosaccharide/beta-1,4-mannosyl-N-acetylglucosamine phosphorylase